MRAWCVSLLVVAMAAMVAADLPVHCPHHKIKGAWEFSMTKANRDKSLKCNKKPTQTQMCFYGSCFTNKVIGEANFKSDMKWKVSLANPNIALVTDDKGKKHKGKWTSVYDEGFEVDAANRKFFAFSKFANGKSLCKKTWPGWHRDSKNPDKAAWGCYTGAKTNDELLEEHVSMLTKEEYSTHLSLIQEDMDEVAPTQPKAYMRPKEYQAKKYQPEHELVRRINAKATTWKAKVYPQFEKMTVGEFNRIAGFRPAKLKRLNTIPRDNVFLEEFEKEVSDLPANFDWRNKDGQNYVDPVINQACGSCYAVSTTSMINSRIRIMTKNRQKPRIPYNQVLACDRYNQGCAGGYPYLVEKFTQDMGLTTSGKCAKSKQELNELGEGATKDQHTPFVRMKSYGYIGGYYGGTTTAQMMRELHANGPIVVGLNGGYELMHYESGIFIETGEGNTDSAEKQKGIRNDFESVDHAVLVVGWGTDKNSNKKHWIIKNSFGSGWGENGYFRVPLGGDVDGITSLTSAGKPVLGDESFFNEAEN